jgi:hypothetical protein
MFNYFTDLCIKDNIKFDPLNQRVRCLGHIINLAAQLIIKNLKSDELIEEFNENENENENEIGIIEKVI